MQKACQTYSLRVEPREANMSPEKLSVTGIKFNFLIYHTLSVHFSTCHWLLSQATTSRFARVNIIILNILSMLLANSKGLQQSSQRKEYCQLSWHSIVSVALYHQTRFAHSSLVPISLY